MRGSVERAIPLLAHRHVIFFEVWIEAGEDVLEVAQDFVALNCRTSVDHTRGVVRVFAPGKKPGGLVID